jgi:hypothetical protein
MEKTHNNFYFLLVQHKNITFYKISLTPSNFLQSQTNKNMFTIIIIIIIGDLLALVLQKVRLSLVTCSTLLKLVNDFVLKLSAVIFTHGFKRNTMGYIMHYGFDKESA